MHVSVVVLRCLQDYEPTGISAGVGVEDPLAALSCAAT